MVSKVIFFFKHRSVVQEPLWLLFIRSLFSEIFPSALKFGPISPILKSCDSTDLKNYRPITILPHLSKLFETLALSLNHILPDQQNGFRPERSTVSCNLTFRLSLIHIQLISWELPSWWNLYRFSKAFDRGYHIHLMLTLDYISIGEHLLFWLHACIIQRVQLVNVASTPSLGVPQGVIISHSYLPCT